jgi:hydroxyethylthiazole kinase-like uncharacterized protein yjeF
MTEILTSAQMRAIERAAIESGKVSGAQLMERAGAAAVAALFAERPALAQGRHRAAVLCGPGNNGGDGYVIARLLAGRGWAVEVLAWGDPARMSPDARGMKRMWDGPTEPLHVLGDFGFAQPWPEVVVDAVFGTGLTREIPREVSRVLNGIDFWIARVRPGCTVLAVDLPSGVNPDTGACPLSVLPADLTVTFHAEKHGHRLGRGPKLCGKVVVADIGLGPWDHHRHDA